MIRDEVATAVVSLLARARRELPAYVREAILELGQRAVRPLIAVVVDSTYWSEEGPGEGYASVHAALLLGEMQAAEAVQPLLWVERVMEDLDDIPLLWQEVNTALSMMGAVAVEPTLAAYHASDNRLYRWTLLGILAAMGVRDDRIYDLLVEQLIDNPDSAVANLEAYGDPRGIEILRRHMTSLDIELGFLPSDWEVATVVRAIRKLGAQLTAEEQEALERPKGRSLLAEVLAPGGS